MTADGRDPIRKLPRTSLLQVVRTRTTHIWVVDLARCVTCRFNLAVQSKQSAIVRQRITACTATHCSLYMVHGTACWQHASPQHTRLQR